MEKIPNKALEFIFYFAKKHKVSITLFALLVLIENLIMVNFSVYTIKYIVDYATELTGSEMFAKVIPLAILYAFEWLIWLGIIYIKPIMHTLTIGKIEKKVRTSLFNYTIKHSFNYFATNFGGNIANKINNVAKGTEDVINYTITEVIVSIAALAFFIVTFAQMSILFFLLITGWLIITLILSFPFSLKLKMTSRDLADSRSKFTGILVDILSNVSFVKAYSRENKEKIEITKETENVYSNLRKYNIAKMKASGIPQSVTTLFIILVMFLGLYLKNKGQISIGDFVFLLNGSTDCLWLVQRVTDGIMKVVDNLGVISEGLGKTILPHEVNNIENAEDIKVTNGRIEIKNISFAYKEKRKK